MSTVSVVIPSHPGREKLLVEATNSVDAQTYPIAETCIAIDRDKEGAAVTRQRALDMATSEWVSFLDSDDYYLPQHVDKLMACAQIMNADYVFSYFVRRLGGDPLGHFGKVFDPKNPHHTTMTVLVRRELAQEVGFHNHPDSNDIWPGEDWRFTLECIEKGAKIVHLPEETWVWRRHGGNTSGLPTRGDAK